MFIILGRVLTGVGFNNCLLGIGIGEDALRVENS